MMAGLIFKREPFFKGKSNPDQLVKIAKVLGTHDLKKYLDKYNVELEDEYLEEIGQHSRKAWDTFINDRNADLCSDDAIDLLSKLLVYDHAERILPKDAMKHKYFDIVRDCFDESMD